MSAWYLLNSLGLYPVTPGTGQYLIGIPTVDQATLYLPNGNTIQISCRGNVPQYQFVKEVKLNQASYNKLYINHDDLIQGCQLDFQLGLVPHSSTIRLRTCPTPNPLKAKKACHSLL